MAILEAKDLFDIVEDEVWYPVPRNIEHFNPVFVYGTGAVWPDGSHIFALFVGNTEIVSSGIQQANSVAEAKAACRESMDKYGNKIKKAVGQITFE